MSAKDNIKILNNLKPKKVKKSNEEKEEKSMENNFGSVSDQNINDFDNEPNLNKNGLPSI